MADETRPDPGNSPPEQWVQPLTEQEKLDFLERMVEHQETRWRERRGERP